MSIYDDSFQNLMRDYVVFTPAILQAFVSLDDFREARYLEAIPDMALGVLYALDGIILRYASQESLGITFMGLPTTIIAGGVNVAYQRRGLPNGVGADMSLVRVGGRLSAIAVSFINNTIILADVFKKVKKV